MPKETVRNLALDVERVLVAGAHLAAGDAGLARDKERVDKLVEQLGAKAPPVLRRLSEQTQAAMTASPKLQAEALVTLATTVAQVRAAQLSLAPAEDAGPLAAQPPIATPCNAKELYALHDALVHSGPGRMEKIKDALERDDVADLRLVHAAIQAMGDAYGEVAEAVSTKVVPRFGRAIVEPVRSRLRWPGKAVDGRRLRALVAVEKLAAVPLIEKALAEGSAEMRAAALEAVAESLPGVPELEPLVLAQLQKERAGDVRAAAIGALRGYGSDASLEALLDALGNARTRYRATSALVGSKHPNVVSRLLERLSEAVTAWKAKPKKGEKADKAAGVERQQHVEGLLSALSTFSDPRVTTVGRELGEDFPIEGARAVLAGGGEDDLRWLADQLSGKVAPLFGPAARAAARLPDAFERLVAPLRAKDRDSKLGELRVEAVADSGIVPSGEAWMKVLLEAIASRPCPTPVATLLGRTKDPRTTKALLDAIPATMKDDDGLSRVISALAERGDPAAVDALLDTFAALKSSRPKWRLSICIEQLANQGTVDRVRTMVASEKTGSYSYATYLLRKLEQKFPGA